MAGAKNPLRAGVRGARWSDPSSLCRARTKAPANPGAYRALVGDLVVDLVPLDFALSGLLRDVPLGGSRVFAVGRVPTDDPERRFALPTEFRLHLCGAQLDDRHGI